MVYCLGHSSSCHSVVHSLIALYVLLLVRSRVDVCTSVMEVDKHQPVKYSIMLETHNADDQLLSRGKVDDPTTVVCLRIDFVFQ